jgi:hypothetical protein
MSETYRELMDKKICTKFYLQYLLGEENLKGPGVYGGIILKRIHMHWVHEVV